MHLLAMELFGYNLSLVELVVAITVIVGGIAAFLKAVKDIFTLGWKPAYTQFKEWLLRRRTRKTMNAAVLTEMSELKTMVLRIDTQLRTNGGSTVKDVVLRIDEKVEHLQARVRHQDETSVSAIFELDGRGAMTFANGAFRELVDAEESELLHRDFVSRIHPDDRTRFISELEEAKANKMPLDSTVKFRLDGGGSANVRLQAKPDVRSGGQLIRFFGTASRVSL